MTSIADRLVMLIDWRETHSDRRICQARVRARNAVEASIAGARCGSAILMTLLRLIFGSLPLAVAPRRRAARRVSHPCSDERRHLVRHILFRS